MSFILLYFSFMALPLMDMILYICSEAAPFDFSLFALSGHTPSGASHSEIVPFVWNSRGFYISKSVVCTSVSSTKEELPLCSHHLTPAIGNVSSSKVYSGALSFRKQPESSSSAILLSNHVSGLQLFFLMYLLKECCPLYTLKKSKNFLLLKCLQLQRIWFIYA